MKKKMTMVMSLTLVLVLAAAMLSGCSGKKESRLDKIKKAGEIVMVTSPDFAPMEFEDISSGETVYVGSDIELGKYIAEQLGVELKLEPMDFDSALGAVSTGTADMVISGLSWTKDRSESMLLSDFFNKTGDGGQGILILKEQADQYKTAEDFAGKKVAAQNGSLQYNLVSEQLPDAQIEPITNLNDAVMMLTGGKVDAIASAVTSGEMYLQNYEELTFSEFYFDLEDEGSVLGVPKGETELIEAINEILAEVNEQGLYEIWLEEAKELAKSLGLEVE